MDAAETPEDPKVVALKEAIAKEAAETAKAEKVAAEA